MGYAWTPWIFTLLAVVELVTDQLPSTPSRKVPMQFGARLVTGAPVGRGARRGRRAHGSWASSPASIGAVIGTFGGAEVRARMATAFGRDRPAAFIEDAVAIILGAHHRLGVADEPPLRRDRDRRGPGRARRWPAG